MVRVKIINHQSKCNKNQRLIKNLSISMKHMRKRHFQSIKNIKLLKDLFIQRRNLHIRKNITKPKNNNIKKNHLLSLKDLFTTSQCILIERSNLIMKSRLKPNTTKKKMKSIRLKKNKR